MPRLHEAARLGASYKGQGRVTLVLVCSVRLQCLQSGPLVYSPPHLQLLEQNARERLGRGARGCFFERFPRSAAPQAALHPILRLGDTHPHSPLLSTVDVLRRPSQLSIRGGRKRKQSSCHLSCMSPRGILSQPLTQLSLPRDRHSVMVVVAVVYRWGAGGLPPLRLVGQSPAFTSLPVLSLTQKEEASKTSCG